jgi:hypothetical protein
MTRQTRKKRNIRKKRNMRKTIKQRGGMFSFFKKPLTSEEELKKGALKALTNNGIHNLEDFLFGNQFVLDGDNYRPVIIGNYTFKKFKPSYKTTTLHVSTPTNEKGLTLLNLTDD